MAVKERNYTVDFWRIFLTMCFVAVHVFIVVPTGYFSAKPMNIFGGWAPMMIPFFIFTGYFLMHAVRRTKQRSPEMGALQASGKYLRGRMIYFFPALLIGQVFGFVVNNIFYKIPLSQWPLRFIDSLWEICGFQLTGLGMGNSYVGGAAGANDGWQMLNGPLWYISGTLLLGWLIYFLLMKYEDVMLGFIFPFGWMLSNGAYNVNGWNPAWGRYLFTSEQFPGGILNDKLVHMFFGFGLGCVIYRIIECIKKKYPAGFGKTATGALTVLNGSLNIFLIVHMFYGFQLSQVTVWGLLAVMSFLVLLNYDNYTKCFSRALEFILKPFGKIAMYIYIFHYPLIVPVFVLLGLNNRLLVFAVVALAAVGISILYHQTYVRWIEPFFNRKPKGETV